MQVREVLRGVEPRPDFINPHESVYGTELCECPVCGNIVRRGAYNHHWTYYHGTPFWKEKAVIELVGSFTERALSKPFDSGGADVAFDTTKRTVVTIVLDCGHTRTWDTRFGADFYGHSDTVACGQCGVLEMVLDIIKKAKAVS